MTVGENIKACRKSKGLTQKQLACMLGLAPNTIAQYELGTSQPKLQLLQKIAEALRVSVVSFLPDGWDYLTDGKDAEDSEALSSALEEAKQAQTDLDTLRAETEKNRSTLSESANRFSEPFLRSAVSDRLTCLNKDGLLEVYKRVCELSEIKTYKKT